MLAQLYLLRCRLLRCLLASVCIIATTPATADDWTVRSFQRQQLTDVYFSEGVGVGDINADGIADIVYGPYWFAGPDYDQKHEIFEPVPQNVNGYADHFFAWVYDFNRDGWSDVLVAGFPSTPAFVYENPTQDGLNGHWKKHQVLDWVSNESPQFVDVTGDDQPELVCTRDGFFGFATINADNPFGTWQFHPISEQVTAKQFGHGLGAGDVNGDGRADIIHPGGWYEQPASNALTSRWRHHPAQLSAGYGGAEMYAYDVDGDGLNDIIASDQAHDFGLSWYQQIAGGDEIEFKRHQIMGSHPSENKYGVLFSEPHSLALVDIDGDGLKDIVTGKTYWSHHKKSPMWDAGAVVYWFKLVRDADGVDWIPYQADGQSGIGRQITVADVNADGLPDIVVGGMKGAHVLIHHADLVTEEQWQAAQPQLYDGPLLPSVADAKSLRGAKSQLNAETHRAEHAIEGESLKAHVTGGSTSVQDMSNFTADKWSNNSQLWWSGGKLGDELKLELPSFTGVVDLEIVLTCAGDYAVVQLSLDGKPLGEPIDLYETQVVTTGVLEFPKLSVEGNQHTLEIQIIGANPKAARAYMCAVDYLRIKQPNGQYVTLRVGK